MLYYDELITTCVVNNCNYLYYKKPAKTQTPFTNGVITPFYPVIWGIDIREMLLLHKKQIQSCNKYVVVLILDVETTKNDPFIILVHRKRYN